MSAPQRKNIVLGVVAAAIFGLAGFLFMNSMRGPRPDFAAADSSSTQANSEGGQASMYDDEDDEDLWLDDDQPPQRGGFQAAPGYDPGAN